MSEIQNDSDRAELRKKRRKKERIRALAIVGGAAVVLLLAVVLLISGLVRLFSADKKTEKELSGKQQEVVSETAEVKKPAEEKKEPEKEDKEEDTSVKEPDKKEEPADTVSQNSETETESEVAEEDSSQDDSDPESDAEPEKLTFSDEEIDSQVEQEVSQMNLETKVAKLFLVTPGQLIGTDLEPKDVGSQFSEKINTYPVGGILLKKANIGTPDEFSSLLSNLKLMISGDTLLAVDEQGGTDSPFVSAGLSENVIATEYEIGESLGNAGAYSAGISIGGELKNYGIALNLAPMVDVSYTAGSFASTHGFGKDASTNGELGKNMIRGMKDQNILCAVRAFPGYGDVTDDGNGGKLSSNRTKEQLLEESKPYQDCLKTGADMLMISHVGFPKLRGDQRPASLSSEVITDIVREEWGYDGVVITDYMDKGCIYSNYTYADSAVSAIEAGADMLLSTKNFAKSYAGIMDAVKSGKLTEERIDESVKRILRLSLKYRNNMQ